MTPLARASGEQERTSPNKGRTEGECRHFEVLGVCGYGQCLRRSLDPDKTKRGFAWDRACLWDFEERER
jgi:hypothetical protein